MYANDDVISQDVVKLNQNGKESDKDKVVNHDKDAPVYNQTTDKQVIDLGTLKTPEAKAEAVKISAADILSGPSGLFLDDGKHQMLVKGTVQDKVTLSDLLNDGADLGDWKQVAGTVTVAGEKYEVYQHAGADAEILVQQGGQVDLLNH